MTQDKDRGKKRVLQGIVASDKMDKTVVVKVTRYYKHSLFKKFVHSSKRYKAHDERNECRQGDTVTIVESRPLSADKKWRVQSIIERAKL